MIVTDVEENIKKELAKEGFTYNEEYVIMIVIQAFAKECERTENYKI